MLFGAFSLLYMPLYSLRIFLVSWLLAITHTIAHYIANKSAFDLYGFGAFQRYLIIIHVILLVVVLIAWRLEALAKSKNKVAK